MQEATQQTECKLSEQEIARRAYEIWESHGRPEGDGAENWEIAKTQLLAEQESEPKRPILAFIRRLRRRAASL